MADVALLQFRYSPYNEKVRWTLDLKRIPHVRRSLLPGPHAPIALWRTRQTATPILNLDGRWIAGSANIVAALDAHAPTPALRPETAEDRAEALAIEARFDDGFVPRMRRAALAALLTDPDYMCGLFGEGAGPVAARIFRAVFPVTSIVVAKGNGIDGPAAIEDGKRACGEALDFVAQASAPTGYLVGGQFTHADLAAAAGLAMVFPPAGSPMAGPGTRPAASQALIDAYAGHPGLDWLGSMYARHRPPIREFDGPSPY